MKTSRYKQLNATIWGLCLGLTLTLALSPQIVQAQSRQLTDRMPSNRWSIEVQVGGGIPLKPKTPDSLKSAQTFPSFQIGALHVQ